MRLSCFSDLRHRNFWPQQFRGDMLVAMPEVDPDDTFFCFSYIFVDNANPGKLFFKKCPAYLYFIIRFKKKNENCTILIPKGNSYCCRKSSARGPRFKVSSEGLSAEIDIPPRSPIQVQTKADGA